MIRKRTRMKIDSKAHGARAVRAVLARLCLLAMSANATSLYAAHPLVTEDTGTQGQGNWQLEVNAEVTRDRASGVRTRGFQPAATLSYGATETLDIQLGRPYLRETSNDGTTRTESNGGLDTALDFKWRFFEQEGFSLGLKPGFTFATGRHEAGRGTGRTTFGTLLIASFDQDNYALHAHLGVRRNNNDVGERRTLYQLAVAGMLKIHETTRAILDLSATTNADPTDSISIRYATLGVIYSPSKNIDLDLGWRVGIGTPAINHSLLFGATFRW